MPEKLNKREYNLKYPRRNGWYYSNGEDFVFGERKASVTNVLDVLNKGGLMYWGMQQTARLLMDQPILLNETEREVIGRVYKMVGRKAEVGTTVHSLANKYSQGMKIKIDKIAGELQPYVLAFMKFLEETKPTVLLTEKIVYCKAGWAGRIDLLLEHQDKSIGLYDIKTGNVYPNHGLQLSAYEACLLEMSLVKAIDVTACLQLKDDGNYNLITLNEPLEVFKACLEIFRWKKGDT